MSLLDSAIHLAKAGDYHQAIQTIQNLQEADRQNEIDYYLGLCYLKIGDVKKSHTHFQKVVTDRENLFAYKACHNLASIYKRQKKLKSRLMGFDYLEKALLIAEKLALADEKEGTYQKIASYVVSLNLFEALDGERLKVDWTSLRKDLPLESLPQEKRERAGLTALVLAQMFYWREHNAIKASDSLRQAKEAFRSQPEMIWLISEYQDEMFCHLGKSNVTQEITQDHADLARLFDVGKAMAFVLNLDKLLSLIVDNVIEITQAERGFLMLKGDDNKLKFRIARDNQKGTLLQSDFRISRTIVNRVVNSAEAVLIEDIEASSASWIFTNSVIDLQLKSILCVPLMINEHLLGVIYVDNSIRGSHFDERKLNLLTTLSSDAAIAIDNATLYRNLQEKKKYVENLLAGTKEMTKTNDTLSTIAIVVRHILGGIPPLCEATVRLYLLQESGDSFCYRWQNDSFEIDSDDEQTFQFETFSELTLKDGNIWIPIWQEQVKVAVLSLVGIPDRNIR